MDLLKNVDGLLRALVDESGEKEALYRGRLTPYILVYVVLSGTCLRFPPVFFVDGNIYLLAEYRLISRNGDERCVWASNGRRNFLLLQSVIWSLTRMSARRSNKRTLSMLRSRQM